MARKLNPMVNSSQWEDLKEHLNNLKNLELQALVVATSEQEMYRLQGKLNLLGKLEQLDLQVKEAINRHKED
jgi:hypothetical protein